MAAVTAPNTIASGRTRGKRGRSDLQSEKEKEHGGKQIAQRRQQSPRLCRDRAGQRDARQKGADRRRNLQALRDPRHQQHRAEGGQQNHFVGFMRGESLICRP